MNSTELTNVSAAYGVKVFNLPTCTRYEGETHVAISTFVSGNASRMPDHFNVRLWLTREDAEQERWSRSIATTTNFSETAETLCYRWAHLTEGITAWDNGGETADRYTVLLGDHFYAMSEDANMPNGVCMYIGSTDEFSPDLIKDEEIPIGDLTRGAQTAVIRLLHEFITLLCDVYPGKNTDVDPFTSGEDETRHDWERMLEINLDDAPGIVVRLDDAGITPLDFWTWDKGPFSKYTRLIEL